MQRAQEDKYSLPKKKTQGVNRQSVEDIFFKSFQNVTKLSVCQQISDKHVLLI